MWLAFTFNYRGDVFCYLCEPNDWSKWADESIDRYEGEYFACLKWIASKELYYGIMPQFWPRIKDRVMPDYYKALKEVRRYAHTDDRELHHWWEG